MSDELERKRTERRESLAREQAALLQELRGVGVDVKSVWDLVNSSNDYAAAVPVLLDHVRRPYDEKIREGIARALALRGRSDLWPALVEIYRNEPSISSGASYGAKDGLAVALSAVASTANVPELLNLIRDPAHGQSRLFFLAPLRRRRSKHAEVRDALAALSHDPVFATEIASWRDRRTDS
jgi:hypothetical protein